MNDYTNYIYMTWYYAYLGRPGSVSITRSIDLPSPASLSDVNVLCQAYAALYTDGEATMGPWAIALGLATMLPPTVGSVLGFRALGFREGALGPVVANGVGIVNGTADIDEAERLPSYTAASYTTKTFTYRRDGNKMSWPVCSEGYVSGQSLNVNYNNSFAGTTPLSGPGLLEILNDADYWNIPDIFTRPTVVKRVPNTAPEGNGEGTRLPTFLVDPVSAVLVGDFTYSSVVTTRRNRRLKV